MSLITKIEEVQEYFPAALTVDVTLISPTFPDAIDKYIKQFLGKAQLDALNLWIDNNLDPESESLKALLPYVQRALVRFAIYLSASQIDLKLTGSGFAVTSNANLSPASPERVKNFKESMLQSGWDAIELMLTFLEENKGDYDDWTGSDAYTLAKKNLVNSALEFDATVGINQSRLSFFNFRNTIDRMEYLKIIPVISKDLFDDIILTMKSDEVTTANNVILPLLKKAVIFYTAAEEINPKYLGMADHYMMDVKKILDKTPTDYLLYKESGLWIDAVTNYPAFENTEANSSFVFGAKQ